MAVAWCVPGRDCPAPFSLTRIEDGPVERWDRLIAMLETPMPTVEDSRGAYDLMLRMPGPEMLPDLDWQAYQDRRRDALKAFQQAYSEALPQHIAALPVETAEERVEARRRIIDMDRPGFRHGVDLVEAYAGHL